MSSNIATYKVYDSSLARECPILEFIYPDEADLITAMKLGKNTGDWCLGHTCRVNCDRISGAWSKSYLVV